MEEAISLTVDSVEKIGDKMSSCQGRKKFVSE